MRSMPASMWRAVFSSTTIASSTTKPVATVIAIRLRLLSEKPSRYMTPKVPSSETTVATAGTTVARTLRRNTLTTSTTRTIEISSVISISRSEARIELVLSDATSSVDVGAAAARAARAAARARRRRSR